MFVWPDGAVTVTMLPHLIFSITDVLARILPLTAMGPLPNSSKFPGVDSTRVMWLPVVG